MPVKVKRLSDNKVHELPDDISPKSFVKSVKSHLHKNFAPQFPNGCRLVFESKVMKSRHRLNHYGVMDGNTIDMDDTKNWSSSSSASNSED
jgi:hypothetical protein